MAPAARTKAKAPALKRTVDADTGITLISGLTPPAKGHFAAQKPKYPLEVMEIGQSFLLPVEDTPDSIVDPREREAFARESRKVIHNRVNSAITRFCKKDENSHKQFSAVKVTGKGPDEPYGNGVFVSRLEDQA